MATNTLKHLTGHGTPSVHPPDPHKRQKGLVQAESQLPEDGACCGELDIQTSLAMQAFLIETHHGFCSTGRCVCSSKSPSPSSLGYLVAGISNSHNSRLSAPFFADSSWFFFNLKILLSRFEIFQTFFNHLFLLKAAKFLYILGFFFFIFLIYKSV